MVGWREQHCSSASFVAATPRLSLPVHVSMATILDRVVANRTMLVVASLLCQSYRPASITAYVSTEPYLLDKGVAYDDPALGPLQQMERLTHGLFTLRFVPNDGPHRKLLPQLRRYWDDNVLLVTANDHKRLPPSWLSELVQGFTASAGAMVVATRVHPILGDPCRGRHVYALHTVAAGTSGMALLPTGVAGIAYRPRFLHPIVFNASFRACAAMGDDISFRFATLLRKVPVYVASSKLDLLGEDETPGPALTAVSNDPTSSRNSLMLNETARWVRDAGLGEALDASFNCTTVSDSSQARRPSSGKTEAESIGASAATKERVAARDNGRPERGILFTVWAGDDLVSRFSCQLNAQREFARRTELEYAVFTTATLGMAEFPGQRFASESGEIIVTAPHWFKVYVLRQLLSERAEDAAPLYTWIFYMDVDTVPMVPLGSLTDEFAGGVDLLLAQEVGWNSDTILTRNSPFTRAFVDAAWSLRAAYPACQGEQCALHVVLLASLQLHALSARPQRLYRIKDYCCRLRRNHIDAQGCTWIWQRELLQLSEAGVSANRTISVDAPGGLGGQIRFAPHVRATLRHPVKQRELCASFLNISDDAARRPPPSPRKELTTALPTRRGKPLRFPAVQMHSDGQCELRRPSGTEGGTDVYMGVRLLAD